MHFAAKIAIHMYNKCYHRTILHPQYEWKGRYNETRYELDQLKGIPVSLISYTFDWHPRPAHSRIPPGLFELSQLEFAQSLLLISAWSTSSLGLIIFLGWQLVLAEGADSVVTCVSTIDDGVGSNRIIVSFSMGLWSSQLVVRVVQTHWQ